MKLDNRVLEAVLRLRGNDDWRVFINALGRYGEELNKQFVFSPKDELSKRQGRVQSVTAVLDAIIQAPNNFAKSQTEAKQ